MGILDDLARVLVTEAAIAQRVTELGNQITESYREAGADDITIVCVTNGAIVFGADLMRAINFPVRLDCIRVSSYRDETQPVTEPEIIDNIRLSIADRHVLLVDDVLDTGKTLQRIIDILNQLQPRLLKTCMLLEKPTCRPADLQVDFTGFSIPNEFVVGYGLDFAEHYRNLPCIGTLKPELLNPPEWQ